MERLIIGTRASKLAMIQTRWIITQLQRHWPNLEIVVEQIRTTGDAVTNLPLTQIGGDGVFVMEIERALIERRIDVAVHSLKDLPTIQPTGLSLLVAGQREDVRDVLITRSPRLLDEASALRIGTCSLRRTAQIRTLYPQAEILPLRGNVDTRLRKLDAGDYDAIILAAAGLHRLDLSGTLVGRVNYLSCEQMMPAPGQGALGLETRAEADLLSLLAPLGNPQGQATTTAERMFMRRLGAGCYLPVAAYATISNERLDLTGLVSSLDGQQRVLVNESIPWTVETSSEHAEALGILVAERALSQGADVLIADLLHQTQRVTEVGSSVTPRNTMNGASGVISTVQEHQHV